MRTLAIECATEACSAALFESSRLIDSRYEVLGRGHAERLVPMIAELPDKGRADRILVSLGPGSFTGVRIGLAAARALGLAWSVPVLGYPTLALVALQVKQDHFRPVTICMNGGHGEWFVQNFPSERAVEGEARSLSPQAAAEFARFTLVAGDRSKELVTLLGGDAVGLNLTPDARAAMLLDDTWLSSNLTPVYGRAPDARLPQAVK